MVVLMMFVLGGGSFKYLKLNNQKIKFAQSG